MSGRRARIGILGGTFDPVHLGHIHIAESVSSSLRLSTVRLVISAIPPHKNLPAVGSPEHRLAMLRLAAAERPGLSVSTMEMERIGISYTIDTLRLIRDGDEPVTPVFIIGMDSLAELPTWREYRSLVTEFELAVVDRPGNDPQSIRNNLEPFLAERLFISTTPGAPVLDPGPGLHYLRIPPTPVSSTEIRARAAAGLPLDGLVPPAVGRYIQLHRLYTKQ